MILDVIPENNFDISLFNSKASHPMQCWEWGDAKRKMGAEIVRIGQWNNHQLYDVYQLALYKIPFTQYKIAYLLGSPLPAEEALHIIKNECQKRRCIYVKIEAITTKKQFNRSVKNLIPSQNQFIPHWTIQLDLNHSETELLKGMKQKTRYNIGLAVKKGVYVMEMTNKKGLEIFLKLYFDTCKRKGFVGYSLHHHKIMFEYLRDKIAHILIAFYKKIPVASYQLFMLNNVLYYPYGGSSLVHKQRMGSSLLMWEAIKLGKKLGAQYFDMWGSLEPNGKDDQPASGLTRFKRNYGGGFVKHTEGFDFIIDQKLYQNYQFRYVSMPSANEKGLIILPKKGFKLM